MFYASFLAFCCRQWVMVLRSGIFKERAMGKRLWEKKCGEQDWFVLLPTWDCIHLSPEETAGWVQI